MNQRQAVDQDRHVVAVRVRARDLVLVDDLQSVVVDVLLVDQADVLRGAVVALEDLDVVLLNPRGLLDDPLVLAGDLLREEALPLAVGELDFVQRLKLRPEVRNERGVAVDRQVLVGLAFELLDERRFELGLALVAGRLVDGSGTNSATTVLSSLTAIGS